MDKNILKGLADNEALFEAVKDTVLKQFVDLPFQEGASDELLGQITRTRITGRKLVEAAFTEIEGFKSVKESTRADNPGY